MGCGLVDHYLSPNVLDLGSITGRLFHSQKTIVSFCGGLIQVRGDSFILRKGLSLFCGGLIQVGFHFIFFWTPGDHRFGTMARSFWLYLKVLINLIYSRWMGFCEVGATQPYPAISKKDTG